MIKPLFELVAMIVDRDTPPDLDGDEVVDWDITGKPITRRMVNDFARHKANREKKGNPMSNDQTKNQASTGMSIDTKEFRDLLHAVWRANSVSIAEERTNNLIVHIDAHTADLRAQLARAEVTVKVLQNTIAAALDQDAAPASAQPADDEILALHRQLAAEKLRADQGWQRAEAKSRECIELRERIGGAQPDRGAAQADLSDGARAKIGSIMPCGACVTNVYEAYAAGKRAATPPEQQAWAVPDGKLRQLLQEFVDYHSKPAGLTLDTVLDRQCFGAFLEDVEVREKDMVKRAKAMLAAAPSPTAQPVAPAAPTYWNSQQKMISRAIIGLRDGWATRKDADDALAALEVAASVSPQGAQVGGQPMCEGCDDLAMPLPGGGFGLCQACIDFGKDEQPHSTTTEGAATDSPLVCQQCGADRSKDPCGNPRDCGMIGQAYSAAAEGADGMGGGVE